MCFYLTSMPGQMGNRCGKPGQMQSLAGFLGCCAKALLQPAWQVPLPILGGDPGANDILELAGAEKRVSSVHAAGRGRGREKWVGGPADMAWYLFHHSK